MTVHMSLSRMCNLLLLDKVVDKHQSYPVAYKCYWFSYMDLFLIEGVKVSNYNSEFIYFSLQLY